MRLVSYRNGGTEGGTERWGRVEGDDVVDLTGVAPSLRAALADGADLGADGPTTGLADVELLPPVPDPPRIFCVGLNYVAHREETGRKPSDHPTIFVRFPQSVVGHGAPTEHPKVSDAFDFEGELAVVIGRPGRAIDAADALGHVAGYSCFQDGSVRDYQRHTAQFTPGKNFDRSGSFGPWMVTADEIPDPAALQLTTRLNGEEVQDTGTDLMIFDTPTLIAYLSVFTELLPGDVIATGTPGGVGMMRQPPLWMRPGDTVEVEISGIGTLTNPIV